MASTHLIAFPPMTRRPERVTGVRAQGVAALNLEPSGS